jgi:hypothetical protein
MKQQYTLVDKKRDTFPNSQPCLSQERWAGAVYPSHLEIKIAWGNNNNQRLPHVVGRRGMLH